MADAGRSRPLQPAHSSNHIKFGHFGTATYIHQTRQWHFLRQAPLNQSYGNGGGIVLSPLGSIEHPSQQIVNGFTSSGSTASSHRVTRGAFLKRLPDAAPGLIDSGHEVPPTVQSHSEFPNSSNLLAFGSALILGSDDVQSGLQTTPIAAYTTKEEPNKVKLARLDQETIHTGPEEHQQVHVPCISKDESSTLPFETGQVLELCFPERAAKRDDTWLAVRSTTATSIYQLLHHRDATIYSRKSPIDANFVVEVPISRSGGFQHANFGFNPEDPHQFALVDVAGNWSIWKIKGKRSLSARILYNAQLVVHGALVSDNEKNEQWDGWHRLLWLSRSREETDCLLVANRQRIALFDFGGSTLYEKNVQIGLRGVCWLLDIQKGNLPGHFLALSTSQAFSMTVGLPAVQKEKARARVKVDMYWDHSRAQDDISLRLHVLRFLDAIGLILISARNHLITAWLMQNPQSDASTRFSISDSVTIKPPNAGGNVHYLAVQAMAAAPVVKKESGSHVHRFFKLFATDKDGEILEALYQIPGLAASTGAMVDPLLRPQKHLLKRITSRRVDENLEEDDLVGFVVADSDVEEFPDLANFSKEVSPPASLENNIQTGLGKLHLRLCDLRKTYETISAQFTSPKSNGKVSMNDILDMIANLINNLSKATTLYYILVDQLADSIYIAEIENDSNTLDSWIWNLDDTRIIRSRPNSRSLIDVYNELLDLWMSSLSNSIPDRIRVRRERLIRQVALESHLSSILIKPHILNNQVVPDTSLERTDTFVSDPVLPSDISEGYLPTSPVTASSYRTEQPSTKSSLLSQYCSYERQSQPTDDQHANLEEVLGHIPTTADANPDEYSYNDVELSLTLARNELANQALDSKAKRKAEKLARARKKQLDKQAQIKKVAFQKINSLPSVMSSSQLPIRGVQSSQARPPGSSQPSIDNVTHITMTQPERGAHGKRDGAKIKNKVKTPRKKGF